MSRSPIIAAGLVGLALLSWSETASATEATTVYHFVRDVESPPLSQEELLSAILDADIFAATQANFADLRVMDAAGFVPHLVRPVQDWSEHQTEESWKAKDFELVPLENDGLQITITLDKDDPHPQGLRIVSPLENYEQRVRVFSSADGQDWQPIGEASTIFDYSRYMDVRNNTIRFPASDRRHFRLVIDNVTVEQESELMALTRRLQGDGDSERTEQVLIERRPFRIDRIEFLRTTTTKERLVESKKPYPVRDFRVEEDLPNRQTLVYIDTHREPLNRLGIDTPNRNFSRHTRLEVMHHDRTGTSWRPVGDKRLSRIDFHNFHQEQLSIGFVESRARQYRLVIDNGDSQPLEITDVRAEGREYELIFLAEPKASYRFVYGYTSLPPANDDVAAVNTLLAEGFSPLRVQLAPQRQRDVSPPVSDSTKSPWSSIINHPLLAGSVIGILVLALGWGLYRAVKRMDTMSGNDPSA